MSTSDKFTAKQIGTDNQAVIDYLLKEKGLTREQVGTAVLKERKEKEEEKRRLEEAEAKRKMEAVERQKAKRAVELYNTCMTATLDGKELSKVQDLAEICKCPSCGNDLPKIGWKIVEFADHMDRQKPRGNVGWNDDFVLTYELPILRGTIWCGCGERFTLVVRGEWPKEAIKA